MNISEPPKMTGLSRGVNAIMGPFRTGSVKLFNCHLILVHGFNGNIIYG